MCLIVFVAIIAAGFILLLWHIKRVLMTGVIESLLLAVSTGVNDPSIIEESSRGAETATYATVALVILFAILAGFSVSRLALAPIRHAFEMQKRFISGIAHELRTPLSILRMNNENARFDAEPDSAAAAVFEENIADIDRINEILNNLLLFERMVSADTLRFEEIDVRAVATAATARLSEFAQKRNVAVTITPSDIPTIIGNKTALEQVFFNLIKNAISYTPSGGKVLFSYTGKTNTTISVCVADTGIGIPQKDLPHIFEPFYRSEKTGKLSGTGIGLAVVYEIIKLHKGAIEVESTEGKGTTLTITLPLSNSSTTQEIQPQPAHIAFNFSQRESR
jgi:signal transduction histidine kinase